MNATFSFRIAPPLYGAQDTDYMLKNVAGLEDANVRLTIVDSGVSTIGQLVVSGSGSTTMVQDALGILHNTRVDVSLPGTVEQWMMADFKKPASPRGIHDFNKTLALVINHVIDWYRVVYKNPFVRRVPLTSITGYEAKDDLSKGGSFLGLNPGVRSATAGKPNEQLTSALSERLTAGVGVPLWLTLYYDALAEFRAGQLHVSVLLANSSMEMLINAAFTSVVTPAEANGVFNNESPPTFRQLLKRVNEITPTGYSKTYLIKLADKVNHYRNDVSHGNPVEIDGTTLAEGLEVLPKLADILIEAASTQHGSS